jgi:hypothetical protein
MKNSVLPVRGIILSLVIAFIFAGCGGSGDVSGGASAVNFTTLDLEGTWAIHGVNTGLTLGTNRGGYYGSMTMTTSGNIDPLVSYMYFPPLVGFPVLSGNMTIDSLGFTGGTIATNRGFSFFIDSGLMDTSKTSMLYIDYTNHATAEYDLAVLMKEGGVFFASDIYDDWHMLGLVTNSATSGAIYGSMTIAAAGVQNGGSFVQKTTSSTITGGSISINATGYTSTGSTIITDTLGTWTISSGKLDQSKTFAAFTSASSNGVDIDFIVMFKTAALLGDSDLAGTWYVHGATGGRVTNGTISGTIVMASDGTVTGGSITLPGDSARTISSGSLSVTVAGSLTGSFTLSSSETITIAAGKGRMDQSGRKIAFIDGTNERLYILFK